MSIATVLNAHRSRLDDVFARVKCLQDADIELQSDFARYLCVLVSGFVETAVSKIASEFCRKRSATQVANYADTQLNRLQNVKTEKLLQLVGGFDPAWRRSTEQFMEGARKDALDSVVNLRNKIAHGESVGITYARISEYYTRIKETVTFLEQKFS